ncbi:MAG TPA: response regulator [Anaerolineales bacterium]|nr:response regulator [Anaerolineales bacterium]
MSNAEHPVILVVDDDVDLSGIIRLILSSAGYNTHVANSGQEALEWLTSNRPDLVLLDLMMPDINGFTILRKMRANEPTKQLPIVVLTAKADQETRDETRSMGADEFLTKPVNANSLLDHVKRALAGRKG